MIASTSKKLVEAQYGRTITDDEYLAALEYATMKLNFQSELFHKDFDVDYVTTVVCETINQHRLERLYAEYDLLCKEALAAMSANGEPDAPGIRKGLSKIAAHSGQQGNAWNSFSDHPHCTTVPTTFQYMGV